MLFRFCAVLIMVAAIPALTMAQEKDEVGSKKKFDPKDVIFEHIGDSHTWHILGKSSIPLPVILYTDKGLEVFSSAKVKEEEGGDTSHKNIYTGSFYRYTLKHDKIKILGADGRVDEALSKKVIDFFNHPQRGEYVDGHPDIAGGFYQHIFIL